MAITDEIRKAFDECTVMAGVENDFECVYITKAAALLYLDEIDAAFRRLRDLVEEDSEQLDKWQLKAEYYNQLSQLDESESARLRELIADVWNDAVTRMDFAERNAFIGKFVDRMRELEVEA